MIRSFQVAETLLLLTLEALDLLKVILLQPGGADCVSSISTLGTVDVWSRCLDGLSSTVAGTALVSMRVFLNATRDSVMAKQIDKLTTEVSFRAHSP